MQFLFDQKRCGKSLAFETDSATGRGLVKDRQRPGVIGFDAQSVPPKFVREYQHTPLDPQCGRAGPAAEAEALDGMATAPVISAASEEPASATLKSFIPSPFGFMMH